MIQDKDVEFYKENGYLLVKAMFSREEVEEMRAAIDRIIERANETVYARNHRWGGDYLPEEDLKKRVLRGYHNVEYHEACFIRAITHPRMVAVLTRLIGPNVQLHHSKMLVKPPEKGAAFPMHQDYPYFPHEKHTMLAASVHLDDADMENGCICVIPGSHKLGPMVTHEGRNYLDPRKYTFDQGVPCPAEAGDVLFFNYLTIHGSGPNNSDRTRRNVLFQYRDPADLPTEDKHVDWGQGLMVAGENPHFRDFNLLVANRK
jgi:ectoine hydroxylase-related dioxygenase (phytanoyl-CoA dioxygenase family)